MTLSARIPVGPSVRLALLAVAMPVGGLFVAVSTLVARWPGAAWLLTAIAIIAALAVGRVALARHRRAISQTLIVSQHAEFEVQPDPLGAEGAWRLVDSTVVWPGFSMLALRKADPTVSTRLTRLAVLDVELADRDRRALSRFLVWSLRGGDSRPFGDSSRP